MSSIMIVLVGDPGVGKTSLISSLVSQNFSTKLPATLQPVIVPPELVPEHNSLAIIDTSSAPDQFGRTTELIMNANTVVLVTAHDVPNSFSRVTSYWLPLFEQLEVTGSLILAVNKSGKNSAAPYFQPLVKMMRIRTCIPCSAKHLTYVSDLFFQAQLAAMSPLHPLINTRTMHLEPLFIKCLHRLYRICNFALPCHTSAEGDNEIIYRLKDALTDEEYNFYHKVCFGRKLKAGALEAIKHVLGQAWLEGNGKAKGLPPPLSSTSPSDMKSAHIYGNNMNPPAAKKGYSPYTYRYHGQDDNAQRTGNRGGGVPDVDGNFIRSPADNSVSRDHKYERGRYIGARHPGQSINSPVGTGSGNQIRRNGSDTALYRDPNMQARRASETGLGSGSNENNNRKDSSRRGPGSGSSIRNGAPESLEPEEIWTEWNNRNKAAYHSLKLSRSITFAGFCGIHRLFLEAHQTDSVWRILRVFGYGLDLRLCDSYLALPGPAPLHDQTSQLTKKGLTFLECLFDTHDFDRDGGLSPEEFLRVFAPCPEIPFEYGGDCTATTSFGYVSKEGWLAKWSALALFDPHAVVSACAYLGYPCLTLSNDKKSSTKAYNSMQPLPAPSTFSRLVHTNQSKSSEKWAKYTYRSAVYALVFGSKGSGKTSMLRAFVGKPFSDLPSSSPQAPVEEDSPIFDSAESVTSMRASSLPGSPQLMGVHSGERETKQHQQNIDASESMGFSNLLPIFSNWVDDGEGERESMPDYAEDNRFLMMREVGSSNECVQFALDHQVDRCDLVCVLYDANNANSFKYAQDLIAKLPPHVPCVLVRTKADDGLAAEEKTEYDVTRLSVSVKCNSLQSLRRFFHTLFCAALSPSEHRPVSPAQRKRAQQIRSFAWASLASSLIAGAFLTKKYWNVIRPLFMRKK